MRYKDTDKPLPEIGRELNVDAVVEGSVLRAGDRVRVTAQLIHAATDQHIWADNYDRDLRDILALHSEVARTITREIQLSLTPLEESLLASARPVNPEAHEAYLRGNYYWERRSHQKGIEYLQQAIDIDPGYAPAYAKLAAFYGISGLTDPDSAAKAKALALKAVELDENLADGHSVLGYLLWAHEWDWEGGEQEHLRAIELNPGSAGNHFIYGNYLGAVGRRDEALTEHQKALELDPLSLSAQIAMARYSRRAGRHDEAIEKLQKTLELAPDFYLAHWELSENYYDNGMYEESLGALKEVLSLWDLQEVVEALEQGYRKSGYQGAMRAAANRLANRPQTPVSFVAMFFLRAGEKDEALNWLERATKGPDIMIVSLKSEPIWDPVRSNPRFQEILRRMNFPE
jgi:tetratricopeptide (TPR) repeat protein